MTTIELPPETARDVVLTCVKVNMVVNSLVMMMMCLVMVACLVVLLIVVVTETLPEKPKD